MAGTNFLINTTFGVANGVSYTGQTIVTPDPDSGNNPQQVMQAVAADEAQVDVTICETDIAAANIGDDDNEHGGGFGLLARVTALNDNEGTPSVTVKLMNSSTVIKSYVLTDGQAVVRDAIQAAADLGGTAITAIKVTPDATSDIEIVGYLNIKL